MYFEVIVSWLFQLIVIKLIMKYTCKDNGKLDNLLTHWHLQASVQHTNIGSDNGLSPVRRQAIIWTNAAILSIRPQETYFIEILFKIQKFSFKRMHLDMSSAKWRPFSLGLNVLNHWS